MRTPPGSLDFSLTYPVLLQWPRSLQPISSGPQSQLRLDSDRLESAQGLPLTFLQLSRLHGNWPPELCPVPSQG